MSVRAGIVVTGTEVLSGIIADRNGPWLSERLREHGVELAHIVVVGDRPEDLRAALDFLAGEGVDLVITSGGLGPTADDLTAEVVADFAGREMALDAALEERIWAIVDAAARALARRRRGRDAGRRTASRRSCPAGATVLEPVGHRARARRAAAGTAADGARAARAAARAAADVGRRRSATRAVARRCSRGAGRWSSGSCACSAIPEPRSPRTLRELEADGIALEPLEITTCLRRGEIEVATVFAPAARGGLRRASRRRCASATATRSSPTTARRSTSRSPGCCAGRTIAIAESCTGGLMAARLTDRAGSSAYVLGGLVVYSNEAKVALAGVPAELIERHGAVSPEVAAALADGARARFGADLGIGITGIAGPGGGTPQKPVGTVCISVAGRGRARGPRRCISRAGAPTSATARPRSPCTCCARCCSRGERAPSRRARSPAARSRRAHSLRAVGPARRSRRGGRSRSDGRSPPVPPAVRRGEHPSLRGARRAGRRSRLHWRRSGDAARCPRCGAPVADEALHVTLAFLGHRPEEDVEAAAAVIAGLPARRRRCDRRRTAPAAAPRARPLRGAGGPDEGVLAALQAAASAGLEAAGLYMPERRPFRPHVTVARLRAGARAPRAVTARARSDDVLR